MGLVFTMSAANQGFPLCALTTLRVLEPWLRSLQKLK